MLLTTKHITADRQHKIYATGHAWDVMLAGSWWKILGEVWGSVFHRENVPEYFPGLSVCRIFFFLGGGNFHREMFG